MNNTKMKGAIMFRVWVNTKALRSWNTPYDGMRVLHEDIREIWEFNSINKGQFQVKTIYSNKTCMRNIEVAILDEGIVRLI